MVYLLTTFFTKPDGKSCFNPTTDTEVFNTYFAALRWLIRERRAIRCKGYHMWTDTPIKRSQYGRETLFCLCYKLPYGSVTRLTISRININGYH